MNSKAPGRRGIQERVISGYEMMVMPACFPKSRRSSKKARVVADIGVISSSLKPRAFSVLTVR